MSISGEKDALRAQLRAAESERASAEERAAAAEEALRAAQGESLRLSQELAELRGDRMDNTFGSQIRNYVLYPYQMVKDNRTGFETSNVSGVMDGDLDGFINAYLKAGATGNWATK